MNKVCVKCKEQKEVSLFWNKKTSLDGYNNLCKSCSSRYVKKGPCTDNPSWYKKGHVCVGGFDTRIKKGQRISPDTEFKKGQKPMNAGVSPSIEVKAAISKKLKGITLSTERRVKMSEIQKERVRLGKHNNYKGGITPINAKIRASFEYKIWRESVFKRDGYTCVECGLKSGNGKAVVLNADHILPFATHPELRLDISNGRTLCFACHIETPTYGFKMIHTK